MWIRELGRGGTSHVFLAADRRDGKKYAVKCYDTHEAFFQAESEWRRMRKLCYPAIPAVRETIHDGGQVYVVMDYVPGTSLKEIIRREKRLPEMQVVLWGTELCNLLSYLHSQKPQVLYRDLKPANIIVTPVSKLKLIDFGSAVEWDPHQSNTAKAEAVGTVGYAAPEQFGDSKKLDQRTDIYALGATLHQMLTGENPCISPGRFEPIRKCNKKISSQIERVVMKCLEKEPENRYRFCQEVKKDLENINSRTRGRRRLYITRSETRY